MSVMIEAPKPATPANKTLWAAVGVLSVAVLAMGATLIRIQSKPDEPRLAVLPTTAPVAAASVSSGAASAPAAVTAESSKIEAPKKSASSANHSTVTNKAVVTKPAYRPSGTAVVANQAPVTAPASAETTAAENLPTARLPKVICGNCGTIEAVTPIQRDGAGSGVGVVAGGVLGAVVGNQVGDGTGKTLATILGGVAGGLAGNAVEKKMKKETLFQVQVRMEDGSTRTLEQATAPTVGARVIVEGNTLQAATR